MVFSCQLAEMKKICGSLFQSMRMVGSASHMFASHLILQGSVRHHPCRGQWWVQNVQNACHWFQQGSNNRWLHPKQPKTMSDNAVDQHINIRPSTTYQSLIIQAWLWLIVTIFLNGTTISTAGTIWPPSILDSHKLYPCIDLWLPQILFRWFFPWNSRTTKSFASTSPGNIAPRILPDSDESTKIGVVNLHPGFGHPFTQKKLASPKSHAFAGSRHMFGTVEGVKMDNYLYIYIYMLFVFLLPWVCAVFFCAFSLPGFFMKDCSNLLEVNHGH